MADASLIDLLFDVIENDIVPMTAKGVAQWNALDTYGGDSDSYAALVTKLVATKAAQPRCVRCSRPAGSRCRPRCGTG